MDKQKMRLPLASLLPQTKTKPKFLHLVCLPPSQFQGLGGRVLVILDCAMLAGSDWNAAWLHDVWDFGCPTLPTPQSSQNLTAAHLFTTTAPKCPRPTPTSECSP